MKFTNGFWLLREGVSLSKAVQLQKIEHDGQKLELLYATKKIEHRGNTLNIGTVGVEVDSPLDDVIRLKATHLKGAHTPLRFSLNEHQPTVKISDTDGSASFSSGNLTAKFSAEFGIEWFGHDNKIATQSDKGLFYASAPEGKFIGVQMPIGVGEQIYGLGERFTAFVKNGQSLDVWNEDPGTNTDQAYK
ncbi:MAG: alpha-xylosidase, partial [Micrococcales bacterium]